MIIFCCLNLLYSSKAISLYFIPSAYGLTCRVVQANAFGVLLQLLVKVIVILLSLGGNTKRNTYFT